MPIEFENSELTELTPKIAVIGVGGAGCNAVSNMIKSELQGVDFVVANTDAQSLMSVPADTRIQLGVEMTQGLGAGAQPKVGEAAAEESLETIDAVLEGCHMAFITAGMGGGTGTGASPVIARRAREKGILTVGVVTKPFHFEGTRRMKLAEAGIKALQDHVDTLIIIPNQNLFHVASDRTTFQEAFQMADEVLHSGVRSVTDLMVVPGLINLDFADVRTVMTGMGKAMMGTGEAEGENRAYLAAEAAVSNQLLEDASLKGAKGVIINVTGGTDLSFYEVDAAANMVREMVDEDALIVFGSALNQELDGKVRVSVVATGIEGGPAPQIAMPRPAQATRVQAEETVDAEQEGSPSGSDTVADQGPEVPMEAALEAAVADDAAARLESLEAQAENTPESASESVPGNAAGTSSESSPESSTETISEAADQAGDDLGEMISASEALELKVIEARKGNSFIADAPMVPRTDTTSLGSADVFAESDYSNSQSGELVGDTPASADASAETPASPPAPESLVEAPAINFFQKVTRRLGGDTASNDAGRAPTQTSMALGGVSAEERPAPSPSREEDQKEIPGFLKRQSN